MNLRILTAMVALAAALIFAAQARADQIDFFLNQPECPHNDCTTYGVPALLASPSIKVIVTENSSTSATVEFLALSGTIDNPAYINVNGTINTSTSTVLGYNSGSCSAGCSVGGITYMSPGQAEDHFGDMNTWTGSQTGDTEVLFTLVGTGTNWTDAADVLKPTTGYDPLYGHGFEAVTAAQNAGYYAGPAPSIGHGLPGILAVAGVLFGAGLIKRGKKHGVFGVRYAG
jgi:hypothetical protein